MIGPQAMGLLSTFEGGCNYFLEYVLFKNILK
jgi:hypothetical protein